MGYIVLRYCLMFPIHKAFGEKKNRVKHLGQCGDGVHCLTYILRHSASMEPMHRCPVEHRESEMAGKINKWKIDAQCYSVK